MNIIENHIFLDQLFFLVERRVYPRFWWMRGEITSSLLFVLIYSMIFQILALLIPNFRKINYTAFNQFWESGFWIISINIYFNIYTFCVSWGIFAFKSSSAGSGQCSFTNSLISAIDIFSTSTFFGRQANEAPRRHVTKRNITWLFYACESRLGTRNEGDSNRATVLVFGTDSDRRFESISLLKLLSRFQISRAFLKV